MLYVSFLCYWHDMAMHLSFVRRLQQSTVNREQLRYLSGEWFYETKQLRHQDRIHGSDLIRASMRQTYKPLTICKFLWADIHVTKQRQCEAIRICAALQSLFEKSHKTAGLLMFNKSSKHLPVNNNLPTMVINPSIISWFICTCYCTTCPWLYIGPKWMLKCKQFSSHVNSPLIEIVAIIV